MLSSFTIKNFKSIVDLTVNFDYAEGKAPNGYKEMDILPFLSPVSKKKIIPCLGIYGANASGKTNILKALAIFKQIIQAGIEDCFVPNRLNGKFSDTFFSLDFYVGKNLYTYTVQYNTEKILFESLRFKNDIVFEISKNSIKIEKISTKTYTHNKLREIFEVECNNSEKQQKFTFLNKIATNYAGLNKILSNAFKYLMGQVEIYPINHFPMALGMEKLAETADVTGINEAFEKIVVLLRKLDIDISRMSYEQLPFDITKLGEWKGGNVEIIKKDKEFFINNIRSYHKDINGREVEFKFTEESDGTQILAGILGVFLSVLNKGGVLVIDELERSLHPLLLIEIIRLFKDKQYNMHNAQLIFTAHNTDILDNDLLRVSEIGIVRKTLKDGTKLRRIAEFQGIRNVSNFRKQYLQGVFSGIPYPYI